MPATEGPLSSAEKVRLSREILALYLRARWGMRRDDLPSLLARLRRDRAEGVEVAAADGKPVGRALGEITTRTLAALPTDGRCLVRSLVLTGLLSRRGVESKLVLAVHPGETLAAHAWVEYEGIALLEPGEPPLERLAEL